ncbi:oligopeptide ABC transporter ATP-binding protein [Spiroplasma gladiatoris]|uniref:Oligopeptide ABC transporter ATP-binding protein n=1 Tax=Spiroplasma gladiatoris TaxID=2143 RepID=A0A4P7AJM2_9MOLU|nr:oligopeptide/dipeptide ABC transporter ATP-binding protein [Spiroplasma gladiatoris]QBQ07943.1 oligopeptide ABC transporter ATP-binding protein [Spiroplasma gladiatoris]
MNKKILALNNIEVKFQVRQKFLTAIRNVSLDIYDQEILAIVGESGSGKSVVTKTFTGMLESNGFISEGSIIYYPSDLNKENNYFKEQVDLVSLQKDIADKYTIKSIVKNTKNEINQVKKQIKKLSSLNIDNINDQILKLENKIEGLKNKNDEFSSNNSTNIKISFLNSKLKSYKNEKKCATDVKYWNEVNDKYEEKIFNLEVNKRKIRGLNLIDKILIGDTINFFKRIVSSVDAKKISNNKFHKVLMLSYKINLIGNLIKKSNNDHFINRNKLYLESAMPDFYEQLFLKDISKEYWFDLLNKLLEEYNNLKDASTNELFNKKIYNFLDIFNSNYYNFEIEIMIEKFIINLMTKSVIDKEEFNQIISRYKDIKGLKIINKLKAIKSLRNLRGKTISTIFQDPMTSLNPLLSVGFQISEVLRKKLKFSKKKAKEEAIKLLEKVGIKDAKKRYKNIPGQYSGGMRQRVVIAIALASQPKILICDEPTTALDVTIQAQILDLIKELQREYKFTVVFITHDLGVVAKLADRVAVMYAGQIIEYGLTDEIFHDPKHPYTWSLLSALPQLGEKGKELFSIKGAPPSLFKKIEGDAFSLRSEYSLEVDKIYEPPMFKVSETHYAKTWLLDQRAPKTNKPEMLKDLRSKIED